MAKGKAKFNSSGKREGVAPPQSRSLRSRKRECPSDEFSLTVDGEATLHQQDTEGNKTTVVITPLQYLESSLQDCATITKQLCNTAERSCLTKDDDYTGEKHAEKTRKASEEQEVNSATYPSNDSQLQGFIINPDNDTNKGGKEEINPQEVTKLPSDTCTDQHQMLTSEEGDGSCAAVLEKQPGAKKISQCNLERNHESSHKEPSHMCVGDLKEVTKESALGLPARKKRRMGMCGLTEKERSHFLQTQKRENGHNEGESVEKQFCNNTADLVAQEEIAAPAPLSSSPLPSPVDSFTVQSKAELQPQSSHCVGDNRAETEVCVTVTTLDGTRALCYPGCSEGKTSEAAGGTVPDPVQTDESKSNQSAEENVEGHSWNLEEQEHIESPGEIPVKKRKDDESAGVNCSPFITFYTNSSQNEETEKKKDGSEAAPMQVCVTRTRDELMDDTGAEAGAASTDSMAGGLGYRCVELCETAVTPSNSERKDNCCPDVELVAGSSTVNTENTQTGDTTEPFGLGYLDYISDSQLNSIALIEEEMMVRDKDPGFSYCHEDATNLICGLIRELSSLNRKVMATHRELENLRRGSKTSRSSVH